MQFIALDLYCMPEQSTPDHGTLNCTQKNTFGSVCTFACSEGYNIKGNGIVHCDDPQHNGDVHWSGLSAFCEGMTRRTYGLSYVLAM